MTPHDTTAPLPIDRIEVRELALPLVRPFETSFGTTELRRCLLVRLESQGLSGWGEIPVEKKPTFGPETTSTARDIIRDVIGPALLAAPPGGVPGVVAVLARLRGHPMAKAGVEAAAWDLECARTGTPLARLLGSEREAVPVGISLGVQPTIDDLVERVAEAAGQGYRRVKIKIKPGWDVDVVAAVRSAHPDVPLMVDANGAYRLEDAAIFEALDLHGLLMIEQPLHPMDLVDHGRLQSRVETPICLDESIRWRGDVEAALRLGSCRIVNCKPARVGGITETLAIHEICHARGVPLWCGGLLETGVGRLANLAVASLPGFTLPGDISESARYYDRDIVDPPVRLGENGHIHVPAESGVAGRLDTSEVERRTVAQSLLEKP